MYAESGTSSKKLTSFKYSESVLVLHNQQECCHQHLIITWSEPELFSHGRISKALMRETHVNRWTMVIDTEHCTEYMIKVAKGSHCPRMRFERCVFVAT